MKIFLSVFIICFAINLSNAKTLALFSPHQGKDAFNKIYQMFDSAKSTIHGTIYSWSDDSADRYLFAALKRGVKVRIALHPSLYNDTETVQKRVARLERQGAEFKIANMNMHEKFFIIDNKYLVNSSANMSGGAQKRYSENFIFVNLDLDDFSANLIKDFRQEFSLIWDSATDIRTKNDRMAQPLFDLPKDKNFPIIHTPNEDNSMTLYSSSMNFKYSKSSPGSSSYNKGRYLIASPIKLGNAKIWTVKDKIIKEMRKAKSSILMNMNHFFLSDIRFELIKAAKRGINIRLTMDNQEFKENVNAKAETPRFVRDWLKIDGHYNKEAPVRIKYYSHLPSPAFWYLNHHKYILIDYDLGAQSTVLITGSYNLSLTAEHLQYDNMVVINGNEHIELFDKYKKEFDNLWFYNRDANDIPKDEVLDQFKTANYKNEYPLHINYGVSLNWSEIFQLRKEVKRIVPGLFKGLYKFSNCLNYNIVTNLYTNCVDLQ